MRANALRPLLADQDSPVARIVRAMSITGPCAAIDLVRVTGLARSTVSQALTELRRQELIVDLRTKTNGMGRPTATHSLNPDAGRCAGVLFGLDEIRIAICDMAHNVLSDRSVPVTRDYGPHQALDVLNAELGTDCAKLGMATADLVGLGLAVSAPVSREGVVMVGSVLPTWGGIALAEVFGKNLDCPVHADNESHCGALAEMTWGAAIGEPNFVLIKFDLGIGGAIVAGGQVQRGLNGAAAEFGHLTLDPQGTICRCGNRGCLETMVGLPSLLRMAQDLNGGDITPDRFVAEALDGNLGYRRLIEDAAGTAGWAVGLLGTTLNPPLFIVTGGLAKAGDLFLTPLVQSYERHTLSKTSALPPGARSRFTVGRFMSNDTVLGAVALVLHQECRIA